MRLPALTLLLLGCAAEPPPRSPSAESQSYPEAVRMICDVDRLAAVDPDDPLGVEGKRSDYLMEHIHNSDGIYLVTLYRVKDTKQRAELLTDAVAETKLSSCPLLATLASGPAEPGAVRDQTAP